MSSVFSLILFSGGLKLLTSINIFISEKSTDLSGVYVQPSHDKI